MDATLAHLAADAGLDVADQFADRLDADLLKLAATGHAGVSRDWISHGLRLTVIGNFSVYFRVTETETIILRVLRGSRDISRVAFDEG